MKRSRKLPARRAPPSQSLKGLDRLDAAMAQREGGSNAERIRRLYEVMFDDVDELEQSGTGRPTEVRAPPSPHAL